jgi:coenzyme F420 biosynthesis associated uncharacterized protein
LSGETDVWKPDRVLSECYDVLVRRSFEEVARYTDTAMELDRDAVHVLGRADWIAANLRNVERLLAPLAEVYERAQDNAGPAGRLVARGTHYAVTGQIAMLFGYLSRRVLGQYDVPILEHNADSAEILFVEPNITRVAAETGIDQNDLRLWVALHETTHAFQFRAGNPPWIKAYIAQQLQAYMAEAIRVLESRRSLSARLYDAWHRFDSREFTSVGLMRFVLTDTQTEALAKIQALMTLMEGYSNHVMRKIGHQLIPEFPLLEARMERRTRVHGSVSKTVLRLLGLELKLEQYRVGERFVEYVVEEEGPEFLHHVWRGPNFVPTLVEARHPAAWVDRMRKGRMVS